MSDVKLSRLRTEWNEIRPAVFELKSYSVDQARRLEERPDDLIRSALSAVKKVHGAKDNGR